jgi:dipeptidyl aminopeptidase/acylaminoacyl peptidase
MQGREDLFMTASRKLTPDDLLALKTMGNIAVSPDGRRVAIVIHGVDTGKNEPRSAIWLLLLDEQGHAAGEPRQLTGGKHNDTNPVWSPDSRRLLFSSDRAGEKNQLWLIDTDGGEPGQLSTLFHGVNEAAWSPDGRWIAFTAPAVTDDDDVLVGRKVLDEAAKKRYEEDERIRLRTVTSIAYRWDGRGLYERFAQLFVMPAPLADATDPIDPATIRRLTSDDVDYSQPSWTPDSLEIGVFANRSENRHSGTFGSDLWAFHHETGVARCLTEGDLEMVCYSWSPDGNSVMVVAAKETVSHGSRLARLHLVTRYGNEGDRTLVLTPDLDNATSTWAGGQFGFPGPYRPQWSQDGQQVYFLVTERTAISVYRIDVASRSTTRLTTDSLTNFLALLPGDRGLLVAQESAGHPWELYRLPLSETDIGDSERLTHFYDGWLTEFAWGKTEHLRYRGANGDEIDGWLTLPIGAREGVCYPLLVDIHGGPEWAFGPGIDPYNQYCASNGYAIFYCNPHGSTGNGEEFMRSVIGDWGGQDFQDVMLGVDECIARGVADPERLVVTGYSYGGFMTMFTIGHTDRFKAAVPMAGISNLTSFVGVSDIGYWMVMQSKGYPWDAERADYYRDHSPISAAARVTTPTLFLHPENDLRCPIEQSEQFYMTLKMMGKVPVEFVRVPGAWHMGAAKPSQRVEYWEKMLEWFSRYVEIRAEDYDEMAHEG